MGCLYSNLRVAQLKPQPVTKPHMPSTVHLKWFRTAAVGFCYVVLIVDIVHNLATPLSLVKYLTGFAFYGITAYMTVT
ncbi:hypothetical protein DSO57_1036520 [Entomophthora muscae]|uniref:Uncharacterized protein n=2 Tax=Entomophthora muscae TaxID=34485 RepID=A0ACC2TLC7_9FUNG|nr:hypothetical protein DSO57_1002847 [Entomophthora muscae]KAJ9075397.1 hypothetical protein DSO57_1036520 [Entomophthora muscae]